MEETFGREEEELEKEYDRKLGSLRDELELRRKVCYTHSLPQHRGNTGTGPGWWRACMVW